MFASAVAIASDTAEDVEFARLAEEAAEGGVIGLASALEMGGIRDWVSDQSAIDTYQTLADETDDPVVRAVAQYSILRILYRLGRFEEADSLGDEMGFVDAWTLIGPFPNDGMSGLAEVYPPELDGLFEGEVDGKVEPVAWRPFEIPFETGYFAASDYARPSHSAAVYVATEFELEDNLEGTLSVAIDGGYRIWIDGEPLAEQPDHLGGFLLRDSIPVDLDDGRHTLLIKIAGIDGALGLHARFLDEAGDPVDAEYRLPRRLPEAEQPLEWPKAQTLSDRLTERLEEGSPAELAAAAFVASSFQPADPNEPWRAFEDRALAEELGPDALLRVASTAAEDWRAAELIGRAVALEPTHLRVTRLAEIRHRQMGEASAFEASDLIRTMPPDERPLKATVLWANMLAARGFSRTALETLLELGDPTAQPLAVQRAVLSAAAVGGREDLELELLPAYLQSDSVAVGYYDDLFLALRAAGRAAEFWDWYAVREERLALRPDTAADRAWLSRAAGENDRATAAFSHAIEQCPGDASLWAGRAGLRLEQNLIALAADDYEVALSLRPQDAEIRELLATLRPADAQFYEEHRISEEEVLALRPESPPEAAYTRLIDQRVTRVFPNGLGSSYVQQAFEVHTRSGADELRRLSLVYTPGAERVEVLSAAVIKPDGRRVLVVDVDDFGGGSGPAAVYYDVRMRTVDFSQLEAGDVLLYEYVESDIAAQNMFDDYFGDLWFIESYTPTEYLRYALQVPVERELFRSESSGYGEWAESVDGTIRTLEFVASDVEGLPRESGAPGALELFEHISVSTYQDWPSLADWYWGLVEDQLVAGPAIVEAVEDIVEGLDGRREIVSAIYGYVVRNTRYVGLEFGIHGYKPYRTTDCFSRRFGDCKDTASLMKVMLGVAGIDSHLVLVRTSDLGRAQEYPPSLAIFNHVITYVPEFDLFLDGTAGFSGTSELPTADQGATAVIVLDGEGGDQVTIPIAPADENLYTRRIRVDLRGETPAGEASFEYVGAFAPSPRVQFDAETGQDRLLERELARTAPGVALVNHEMSDLTDIESPVRVELTFEGGEWASEQESAWLVRPTGRSSDLGNRYAGPLERTHPLEFEHPFTYHSVTELIPPEDWIAEEIPEPASATSPFGQYSIQTFVEDGVVTTEVGFTLLVSRVEPEDYQEFRQFVHDADEAFDRNARFRAGEVAQ